MVASSTLAVSSTGSEPVELGSTLLSSPLAESAEPDGSESGMAAKSKLSEASESGRGTSCAGSNSGWAGAASAPEAAAAVSVHGGFTASPRCDFASSKKAPRLATNSLNGPVSATTPSASMMTRSVEAAAVTECVQSMIVSGRVFLSASSVLRT